MAAAAAAATAPAAALRSSFAGERVPSPPAGGAAIRPATARPGLPVIRADIVSDVKTAIGVNNKVPGKPPVLNGQPGQPVRKGNNGCPLYTTSGGHPIPEDLSLNFGEDGTGLMQDFHMFDKLGHFNRERVPERVVHAKGAGAHGYLEITDDISDICKSKVFERVGNRVPMFGRFSTVTGESGFPDTQRDPRGFALKFYTEEGNWDLVANNTPVFFIRDGIKFPDLIHSQKRHPRTHLKDPDAYWDFLSLTPESAHQVLITFSPRGVPDGYRHMNGYGSHTFKMVNAQGKPTWVKFHFKSDQGTKNLTHEQALEIAGYDPDYSIRDLMEAIDRKDFPSWTFYIQTMELDEVNEQEFDPFDLTKVWSQKKFPLRKVGKLVLDRNPDNYFAEVEQVSFSPAHMPPGIEPSPDRVLQSRLWSYDDAARYRIGTNYIHLPINACPFAKPQHYQADGAMVFTDNGGDKPNYWPNSRHEDPPTPDPTQPDVTPYQHPGGLIGRYEPQRWKDQDDYKQPGDLWRLQTEEHKEQTLDNLAGHMRGAKEHIQKRQIEVFRRCDADLGRRLEERLFEKKTQSSEPLTAVA
eukprot:SM000014S00283  [mRNA]  locus=s14:479093:481820:- [translate_table: standard]